MNSQFTTAGLVLMYLESPNIISNSEKIGWQLLYSQVSSEFVFVFLCVSWNLTQRACRMMVNQGSVMALEIVYAVVWWMMARSFPELSSFFFSSFSFIISSSKSNYFVFVCVVVVKVSVRRSSRNFLHGLFILCTHGARVVSSD
jgi:hypothetical protein